MPNMPGAAEA